MIGYIQTSDDNYQPSYVMTTGCTGQRYNKGSSSMLRFSEIVNKVTVGICLAVVVTCLMFWVFGGYATTVGYTIKADSLSNGSHGKVPAQNVFYEVVEVRDSGLDRYIFSTFDIDDALRVMKEFQNK